MAAFAIGVALILPPTELKSSWTNVRYAAPAVTMAGSASDGAMTFPASAPAEASVQRPYSAEPIDPEAREPQATEEIRVADDDRAYGDGYAWAADRETDDPRACRRFRGPRAEGCRDYVTSQAPADAGEPEDEGRPATSW